MTLEWHKIAEHINDLTFAVNQIAVAELNGKKICIAKFKDEFFAFAYRCPHAGGILAEGYLDAFGNIVCPVHRYKFSITNGRNTSGEGFHLKRWPVQIIEEAIWIGMEPDSGFWNKSSQ